MIGIESPAFYKLRLYVRGSTSKAGLSLNNLQTFCQEYLPERHSIEVIDIDRHPGRAHTDDIIAVPTLVRLSPVPTRRLVGDFSNAARLLQALDIHRS